jgi:hypothetical protein
MMSVSAHLRPYTGARPSEVLMKSFVLVIVLAFGCSTSDVCRGNECVCAANAPCSTDCVAGGGPCEVQCSPGAPCSVGCAAGETCHVECSGSSSCSVDCAGTPDCHVTCPGAACTVKNCVGPDCVVACGLTGAGTHNGTTVTCP